MSEPKSFGAVVGFSAHQKQLFIAVKASHIDCLCRSDTHSATGTSVFATARFARGSSNCEGSIVGSAPADPRGQAINAVQANVSQIIEQAELQEFITRRGHRPTIGGVVVDYQATLFCTLAEVFVVVGVASATILDPLKIVVVVNHFMKEGRNHFLDRSGEGSCTDVDFSEALLTIHAPSIVESVVSIGSWRGLNGDDGL